MLRIFFGMSISAIISNVQKQAVDQNNIYIHQLLMTLEDKSKMWMEIYLLCLPISTYIINELIYC